MTNTKTIQPHVAKKPSVPTPTKPQAEEPKLVAKKPSVPTPIKPQAEEPGQVVVAEQTALAALVGDICADAGLGNENVGQEDVLIPRLKVAQALSPEIKKQKAEFIEGAEEGSIFNSATKELYTQPLTIVNVAYVRRHIEWIPREKGGGLVNANHEEAILGQCQRSEDGGYVLPNGNEIVVTPEHFVIVIRPDGSYEQAVLSMSGSKAKISRAWNTTIRNVKIKNPSTGRMVNPARFYQSWKLRTVPEANDRGDFFNWKVEQGVPTIAIPDVGYEVYSAARAFYDLIRAGVVKAEVEERSSGEVVGKHDGGGAF
jgi:predicted transcriptional regulator